MSLVTLLQAGYRLRNPSPGVHLAKPTATLRYAPPAAGIPRLADVYRGTPGAGSVMLVHGGGFVVGSRRMTAMRSIASRLIQLGYHVCIPDYRMLFRGGRFDEAVDDIRAALTWWRATAPAYGSDAERVVLLGGSAGAAIATVAADEDLAALVSIYGPYDFRALPAPIWASQLLFGTSDTEALLRRSPLTRCTWDIPLFLQQGTADQVVNPGHMASLEAARRSAGLPVICDTIDNAPHGFYQFPNSPFWERGMTTLEGFLMEHAPPVAAQTTNAGS